MIWDKKTLAELATFQSGLWKGKKGPFITANVVRNTNFTDNGSLSFDNVAILDVEEKQFLNNRKLFSGDIVLERSGGSENQPVGRVAFFDKTEGQYSFSNFTSLIRPNTEMVDPKFLHYFLLSFYKQGKTESLQKRTTGIRNLDFSSYKELIILHPSLAEQRKIVLILDHIYKMINLLKEKLVKTHAMKSSLMVKLIQEGLHGENQKKTEIGLLPNSWRCDFAKEYLIRVNFGTSEKCDVKPNKYPVLRIPNVVNEYIDLSEVKYCDLPEKRAESFRLEAGDLIFVRTNGSRNNIGKNSVFENQLNNCLFASFTIRARFDAERINPKFIHYFTQTSVGKDHLYQNARASTGKYNLNTQAIKNMLIPIPSLAEQNEIVEIVDTLELKLNLLKKKNELYQNLFNSLLSQLMTQKINIENIDFDYAKNS